MRRLPWERSSPVRQKKPFKQSKQRYEARNTQRTRASGNGLMGERVREFERIQNTANALRELNTQVAEQEARLGDIEKELTYRASLAAGFGLHLKRLTTI